MLFDEAVLSISRLLDPSSTHGHVNVSIARLINQIDDGEHAQLVHKLKEKETDLKNQGDAIKTWRDKRISHADLTHNLQPEKLPRITRGEIDEVVKTVIDVMNECWIYFYGAQLLPGSLYLREDIEQLMRILKRAKVRH
jgi:hypothetical protein